MNRNRWAAAVSTIVAVIVVISGFSVMGGPRMQRKIQSDMRTVQALAQQAQRINGKWAGAGKVLPKNLDTLAAGAEPDPTGGEHFVYRPKSENEYELCATFNLNSREKENGDRETFWAHPAGYYCYQLDASQSIPMAPYYY